MVRFGKYETTSRAPNGQVYFVAVGTFLDCYGGSLELVTTGSRSSRPRCGAEHWQ